MQLRYTRPASHAYYLLIDDLAQTRDGRGLGSPMGWVGWVIVFYLYFLLVIVRNVKLASNSGRSILNAMVEYALHRIA